MAINNINWTALNTLNGVINNACAICNEQNATDDAVMHLTNGAELTCSYSQTDAPKSLTHFMFSRNEEQKSLNNQTRALFKQAVIAAFGNTIDDVPKKVRDAMNLSKFDNSGRPLTVRRMLAVRRAIAAETAALAKKLGFTGDVAGDVISVVAAGSDLLQEKNPGREFKARMNRNATASLATHIASQWGSKSETTSFELDFNRSLTVTLGGKKLSKTLDAARDEIVQFITGDKTATYNEANDTMKKKARVLMSVLNQGTIACFLGGVTHSFDRDSLESHFSPGNLGDLGGTQEFDFALKKDKAGNITVQIETRFANAVMLIMGEGENQLVMASDSPGVYVKCSGEFKMSAGDLDKLAKADWDRYDNTEVAAMDHDNTIPDHYKKAADMIPAPFKFTGNVKVKLDVHVDSLREMPS